MELRVGNKYRLGRKIGSGSFGDIYLGKCPWFQLSASGAPGTVLGTRRRKDASISGSEVRTWLWGCSGMFWSFCAQGHPKWGGKQQVKVRQAEGLLTQIGRGS